jgi:hypothetical protein
MDYMLVLSIYYIKHFARRWVFSVNSNMTATCLRPFFLVEGDRVGCLLKPTVLLRQGTDAWHMKIFAYLAEYFRKVNYSYYVIQCNDIVTC